MVVCFNNIFAANNIEMYHIFPGFRVESIKICNDNDRIIFNRKLWQMCFKWEIVNYDTNIRKCDEIRLFFDIVFNKKTFLNILCQINCMQ